MPVGLGAGWQTGGAGGCASALPGGHGGAVGDFPGGHSVNPAPCWDWAHLAAPSPTLCGGTGFSCRISRWFRACSCVSGAGAWPLLAGLRLLGVRAAGAQTGWGGTPGRGTSG